MLIIFFSIKHARACIASRTAVGVALASFLFDDTLIDVCDGKACTADHRK